MSSGNGTTALLEPWELCPTGRTVDNIARFAGCNVDEGFARGMGWTTIVIMVPVILFACVTIAQFQAYEPSTSHSRKTQQNFFAIAIGVTFLLIFFSHPVWADRRTPTSSSLVLSLMGGAGLAVWVRGILVHVHNLFADVFEVSEACVTFLFS